MTIVSEEMLLAYMDGELDEVNRRRVAQALEQDTALAARLAAHQRLAHRLSAEYAPLAEQPVPDRFRTLLADSAKVTPIAPAQKRRLWVPVAIAASLALGLLIGRTTLGPAADIGLGNGRIIAQGALAQTLETRLASAQPANVETRIGLSFRAKDGTWCRSFEGRDISGVACRGADGWHLKQALPGRGVERDFRQASSADPRLLATVEALMAGAPADAPAEKAARDAGWQ